MLLLIMKILMISLSLSSTMRVDGETTPRQAQKNPTRK